MKNAWVNQQVACWRRGQPNQFVVMCCCGQMRRVQGKTAVAGRAGAKLTTGDTGPMFDRLRDDGQRLSTNRMTLSADEADRNSIEGRPDADGMRSGKEWIELWKVLECCGEKTGEAARFWWSQSQPRDVTCVGSATSRRLLGNLCHERFLGPLRCREWFLRRLPNNGLGGNCGNQTDSEAEQGVVARVGSEIANMGTMSLRWPRIDTWD